MGEDIPSRSVITPYVNKTFLSCCALCRQEIYIGDIFYDICGSKFHKNCISENYTASEILTLVGIKEEIAQTIQ